MRPRRMPKYSERKGWHGGDKHAIYAFVDKRTHNVRACPVYAAGGVGPEVTVRMATRAEAEEQWQRPLHAGWKVEENFKIGSSTATYNRLLARAVPHPPRSFSNLEADSLTMAIGRAYKASKISGEERDLLAAFVDARRG